MPKVASVSVDMRGDSSKLVAASQKGIRAVRRLGQGVARTTKQLTGLSIGVGSAAVGALTLLGNAARNNIDAQAKLAANLNVSTKQIQELRLVAELNGVAFETLAKSFQRITRLQGDAVTGNKQAQSAFRALGITLKDLFRLQPDELFGDVVHGLRAIEDPARRASIANQLFQEQWQQLTPLINGYEESLVRAKRVTEGLNLGISDDQAKAVEAFNDNISVASAILVNLRDKVFADLAPDLDRLVVSAGQLAVEFLKVQGGGEGIAQQIRTLVMETLPMMVAFVQTDLVNAFKGVMFVVEKIVQLIASIGDLGAGLAAAAESASRGEFAGAARVFGEATGLDAMSADRVLERLQQAKEAQEAGSEEVVSELQRQTVALEDMVRNNFQPRFG